MVDILAEESILALEGTMVDDGPELDIDIPSVSGDDGFEEKNAAVEPVRPVELLWLGFQARNGEDIR